MSAYTRRDLHVECKRPYARDMHRFVCAFRLRTYGAPSVNPALGGRPELPTLSRAYTEYFFLWPPPYQKSTLKMLILRPFLKIEMQLKQHFWKAYGGSWPPLPPSMRCVRSWKWWHFWTTPYWLDLLFILKIYFSILSMPGKAHTQWHTHYIMVENVQVCHRVLCNCNQQVTLHSAIHGWSNRCPLIWVPCLFIKGKGTFLYSLVYGTTKSTSPFIESLARSSQEQSRFPATFHKKQCFIRTWKEARLLWIATQVAR